MSRPVLCLWQQLDKFMNAAKRPREQNFTHNCERTNLARDRTLRNNVRPSVKNQGCANSSSGLHSYRTRQNFHRPYLLFCLPGQNSTWLYKISAPIQNTMSLLSRHGFTLDDAEKSSPKPTGRRPRQDSSPAHPPVSLAPPNPPSAQLDPVKNKARPGQSPKFAPAPVTPQSSNAGSRKKSWVNSASKTLGIDRLRQKTSFGRDRAMSSDSAIPSRAQSIRQLNVRKTQFSTAQSLTRKIGSTS